MLVNIQALRALAALMVVYVHCEILLAPLSQVAPVFESYRDSLASGVDLFFVISGFIMVYTTMNNPSPSTFFAKRISRIVPLYWTLTFFVFFVALVAPTVFLQTKALTEDLVRSLLFIPYTRSDGTIRPILFVGWSLNFEMLFYFLFGLALPVKNAKVRVVAVIVALVALVALGQIWSFSTNPPMRFFTQPFLLEFIPGMLVGLLFHKIAILRVPRAFALVGFILSVIAIPMVSHINQTRWPLQCVPAGIAVFLALLIEKQGFRASSRVLQLVGAASYSLYLSHPFVTQAMTKAAIAMGPITAAGSIALLVLAYVLAIFVGLVTFKLIEEPASRSLSKLLVGRRRSSIQAGPCLESDPRRRLETDHQSGA